MPNHYSGDLSLTIGISGLSRVRTELFELFVIPTLAPHPVQMHGQLSRHGYLGDLPATSHRKMEKPVAPLRVTAYRDLRCLYQQKPKQRVALLADVPQSAADRRWIPPTAPAPHSWRLVCRSENALHFRSPTRKPAPSAAAGVAESTGSAAMKAGRAKTVGLRLKYWPTRASPVARTHILKA
jgi:hypothetical protein